MAHAGLGDAWDCTFANDFSAMKAQAYASNWGVDHLCVQDIATLTVEQLPGYADLAWASFPCQDLSLAGNGAGLSGARSGTFWPFIALMANLRSVGRAPRVIALENVYGAITSHAGKDFDAMLQALCDLGYRVGAIVMDAVHFVPQSRPRLMVVAVEEQCAIPDDCKSVGPSAAWHPTALVKAYNRLKPETQKKWIWWRMPVPELHHRTLDDLMELDPSGVEWHTAEQTQAILSLMTPVHRKKVMQAQAAKRLRVGTIYKRTRNGVQCAEVRFDGVAGCLRTPGGGSSRQIVLIVDGPLIRSRLLSSREAARLMGLPDTYQLPLRYNDAYHLAGDGVVVDVVAHLAKYILSPVVDLARLDGALLSELRAA